MPALPYPCPKAQHSRASRSLRVPLSSSHVSNEDLMADSPTTQDDASSGAPETEVYRPLGAWSRTRSLTANAVEPSQALQFTIYRPDEGSRTAQDLSLSWSPDANETSFDLGKASSTFTEAVIGTIQTIQPETLVGDVSAKDRERLQEECQRAMRQFIALTFPERNQSELSSSQSSGSQQLSGNKSSKTARQGKKEGTILEIDGVWSEGEYDEEEKCLRFSFRFKHPPFRTGGEQISTVSETIDPDFGSGFEDGSMLGNIFKRVMRKVDRCDTERFDPRERTNFESKVKSRLLRYHDIAKQESQNRTTLVPPTGYTRRQCFSELFSFPGQSRRGHPGSSIVVTAQFPKNTEAEVRKTLAWSVAEEVVLAATRLNPFYLLHEENLTRKKSTTKVAEKLWEMAEAQCPLSDTRMDVDPPEEPDATTEAPTVPGIGPDTGPSVDRKSDTTMLGPFQAKGLGTYSDMMTSLRGRQPSGNAESSRSSTPIPDYITKAKDLEAYIASVNSEATSPQGSNSASRETDEQ